MTTRAAERDMKALSVSKMTEFCVITACDRGAVGFDVADPAFWLKDVKMGDPTNIEWQFVEGGPETEPVQKLLQWLKEKHLSTLYDCVVFGQTDGGFSNKCGSGMKIMFFLNCGPDVTSMIQVQCFFFAILICIFNIGIQQEWQW